MTFDGVAEGAWAPQFRGAVALSATSLRDALRWLDAPAPRASSPLSDFRLAGHASLDRGGLSVSDAELDLDGGSFVGAGRVTAPGGRLTIEANLDAETLDLKPLARGLAPPVRRNGEWSVAPIDLSPLAGFDLDLRLSAEAVLMDKLRLGPTAATLTVAKGGLDLGVGEALAYGGTLRGRLTLQPDVAGARVAIQGSSSGVRLEKALKHLFDSGPPLSGALSSEAAVQGGGRSVAEIVGTLSGRSSARLTDGAIERMQRSRTLSLIGIPGRMEVAEADAEIVIERGVARTERLSIFGPDASFALSGEARLLDRRLDLVGVLRPAAGGWSAPVRVDGPFASPRLRANVSGSVPRQHREAALQR
jgi:AsmA protein